MDEAFAAELAANRAGSADERFNRVLELLEGISAEDHASLTALLFEIIQDQSARVAELEEQLYRVYVKTGESMAQLKKDLGSVAHSKTAASELLSNLKEELKLLRGDVYVHSDMQIQHIEERIEAVEHDRKRAIEAMTKRLSELEDRIEQLPSNARDE